MKDNRLANGNWRVIVVMLFMATLLGTSVEGANWPSTMFGAYFAGPDCWWSEIPRPSPVKVNSFVIEAEGQNFSRSDFYADESVIVVVAASFCKTRVQQARLEIFTSEGKKIFDGETPENTGLDGKTMHTSMKNGLILKPGNYQVKYSAKTEPRGDFKVYGEQGFVVHEKRQPGLSSPVKVKSTEKNNPSKHQSVEKEKSVENIRQKTITSLKSSLNEKILEATGARDEFLKEVGILEKELAENGKKLSEKKQARIKRDIDRKNNYIDLISKYHARLSDGLETLDETEDELRDGKRWQTLIEEESFIKKVDQTIREIIALLNSGFNNNQQPTKERRKKK